MINYTDKETTIKLIDIEKSSLNATLNIQKNLNRQILTFMKTFLGNIEVNIDFDSDNKIYNYINKSTITLNKSNKNIQILENLLKKLDIIYKDIENYTSKNKLKAKIEKYNMIFSKYIEKVYANTTSIEKFIHDISLLDLSELLLENNKTNTIHSSETDEINNLIIDSEELDNSFVENTLIISDIKGKVILPYNMKKIKETLSHENEKYSSIEDVIEKNYTIPIKKYKITPISRFKESYKLIRKKEHGSHLKALSLASELFFNYNLHPAIITACDSLDELDIYLACLDDNTLDDFKFFNIKYEIPPVLANNTLSANAVATNIASANTINENREFSK